MSTFIEKQEAVAVAQKEYEAKKDLYELKVQLREGMGVDDPSEMLDKALDEVIEALAKVHSLKAGISSRL
jgi:hypothetical protein